MSRKDQIILGVLQLLGAPVMCVFTLFFLMQSTYELSRDGEYHKVDFWVPLWTVLWGILAFMVGFSGLAALFRDPGVLQIIFTLLSVAAAVVLLTLGPQTLWITIPVVASILIQALAAYRLSPPKKP